MKRKTKHERITELENQVNELNEKIKVLTTIAVELLYPEGVEREWRVKELISTITNEDDSNINIVEF